MSEPLRLILITPRRYLQLDSSDLIVFSTKSGEMGIMRHHVPTVVAIVPGPLRCRLIEGEPGSDEAEWLYGFVSSGFAEVGPDQVTLVVTAAEFADDIDTDRAGRALERAQERVAMSTASERDKIHGKHAIRRARQRLRVAQLYGGRPGAALPAAIAAGDLWERSDPSQ